MLPRALTHNGEKPNWGEKIGNPISPSGEKHYLQWKVSFLLSFRVMHSSKILIYFVCGADSSPPSTQIVRGYRQASSAARVTGNVFFPTYVSRAGELQLQIGSCLWDFPLCLVWALESVWLQITLTWNNKQKIKMVKAPIIRCHLR